MIIRLDILLLLVSLLCTHHYFTCCAETYPFADCSYGDTACERDKQAYDALSQLHNQLDDDKDGGVDPSEADEFARDELRYTDGFERTSKFYGSDKHISKDELWKSWKHSIVYNWTVDHVLNWLANDVDLPQYTDSFLENNVDGPVLPRLAVNNQGFIATVLKVKNTVHKHKLSIKAMDAVLFGPPKKSHNYAKDMALAVSLVIALGGCWFAYIQYHFSRNHLNKMNADLDGLSKAEKSLSELQSKLKEAEQVKAQVFEEKQQIEEKYKSEIETARSEASRLSDERLKAVDLMERLQLAEEELSFVRTMLSEAEGKLTESSWRPPRELQTWLQVTYEVELHYYNQKKTAVEKQLMQAREGCDKLRKKRNAFMGSMRIAHSSNMDDIDRRIQEASAALEEVRQDLQERQNRWARIESLIGCSIANNSGLTSLRTLLTESGVGLTLPGANRGSNNSLVGLYTAMSRSNMRQSQLNMVDEAGYNSDDEADNDESEIGGRSSSYDPNHEFQELSRQSSGSHYQSSHSLASTRFRATANATAAGNFMASHGARKVTSTNEHSQIPKAAHLRRPLSIPEQGNPIERVLSMSSNSSFGSNNSLATFNLPSDETHRSSNNNLNKNTTELPASPNLLGSESTVDGNLKQTSEGGKSSDRTSTITAGASNKSPGIPRLVYAKK